MIELKFAYRGESICVVALNERDDIPARIQRQQTFYEFDVLERCEFYLKRLRHSDGLIIDVGAYIGNHTVFFANFCQAAEVIAFEASKPSFDVLVQTISRNGLQNVRTWNLAVGDADQWGTVAVRDPENLGANRVQLSTQDEPDAVRIVALDTFLESIGSAQARISLIKIDVEGMECEVILGARRSIAESRPVLCVEILDAAHMTSILKILRETSYLIRECNGAAPTYLLTWESRTPRALIRALNFGWWLLARFGNNAWRWRYRRVLEIVLPIQQ